VTLWQYLNCPAVAAELHSESSTDFDSRNYTPIYPSEHFRSIHAARQDPKQVTSLVHQLVSCLASDAATELARVYEYQIALLGDGLAGSLLAEHAAGCVMDYVTREGQYLELDTMTMGALKGQVRGHDSSAPTPTLSVVVGKRELKWRLDDILKKPGIRLDIYLCSDDYQVSFVSVFSSFLIIC